MEVQMTALEYPRGPKQWFPFQGGGKSDGLVNSEALEIAEPLVWQIDIRQE
jgi:hypothetical protein